jgi:hypothetical protein
VNAAALVNIAIAVLPLARSDAELDQWREDNRPWILKLKTEAPADFARLMAAGAAHRKALSRDRGSLGARRIGGSSDRWSQQPRQDGS